MTAGFSRRPNRIRVSAGRKAFMAVNMVVLLLLCAAMLYPVVFVAAAGLAGLCIEHMGLFGGALSYLFMMVLLLFLFVLFTMHRMHHLLCAQEDIVEKR